MAKPQRLPTHPHSFSHPVLNVFTMSLLREMGSFRPHSFQYQRYDLFIRVLAFEAISSNHTHTLLIKDSTIAMHSRTYFPFQVDQIRSAPSIISQGIVPRIGKSANTLKRTLTSRSFPHAVIFSICLLMWISFTHFLCVKIWIHSSHDRLLSYTPRVTLPLNWQPRGLFDFCHDRMKGFALLVLSMWLIPLSQDRFCGSKPTLCKCQSLAIVCQWFLLDPLSGRFHSGHDRHYSFTLNTGTCQDRGMFWKW